MGIKNYVLMMVVALFGVTAYVCANMALETAVESFPESGPDYWYGAEHGPSVIGENMQQGADSDFATESRMNSSSGEVSGELTDALMAEDVKGPDMSMGVVTIEEEAIGDETETENEVGRENVAIEKKVEE